MKNNILKFIVVFLVQLNVTSQTTSATVTPSHSYALDANPGVNKELNGKNLTLVNNVSGVTNRHNQNLSAILFSSNNSKILLPDLTNLPNLNEVTYTDTDKIDVSLGYTISFWIYFPNNLVGNQLTKPTGTPFPYTTADHNHQIFYGAMTDKSLPIGISRIRDRVVLNRMSSLSQQPPKPWNLWLWDPVSFRRDTWYQLFYVIRFNRTNVYMYDMAGKQSCELNYFHAPNISNVKDWGFGSHDGVTSTNFRLDDIKIYSKALSSQQTYAINTADRQINNTNKDALITNVKEEVDDQTNSSLIVYPNPSKNGTFALQFILNASSSASIEIINLSGQSVFRNEKHNLNKGTCTFHFGKNDVDLSSGLYIIRVVTNEFNETCKLEVK